MIIINFETSVQMTPFTVAGYDAFPKIKRARYFYGYLLFEERHIDSGWTAYVTEEFFDEDGQHGEAFYRKLDLEPNYGESLEQEVLEAALLKELGYHLLLDEAEDELD